MNQVLDNLIENWAPLAYRLLIVIFIAFAVIGLLMAAHHFSRLHPDMLEEPATPWTAWIQVSDLVSWPCTAAPLWWKLAFFISGGLIILPRLFIIVN